MITKIYNLDNAIGTSELSKEELVKLNGGGFAYDFGFFLREIAIYVINGQGATGTSAVVSDYSINYQSR